MVLLMAILPNSCFLGTFNARLEIGSVYSFYSASWLRPVPLFVLFNDIAVARLNSIFSLTCVPRRAWHTSHDT
jgi:hypothetical protein